MSKQVPSTSAPVEAAVPSAPDSLPPPEGEGAHTAQRASAHPSVRPEPVEGLARTVARTSPLATLNTHIAKTSELARQQLPTTTGQTDATHWPTLRSAQRFHETWSRISAETEVVKAEQRAPDNAGPLNSHKLVLHTLSLMRNLSPDYLRGFLAQAETLLWLEQAHGLPRQTASAKGGVVKASRKKK